MKRYEGALRRLSILFILINLLSPLSAATTAAQDQTTDTTTTQTAVGTVRIILEGSNGNIPGGAFWVGGTYAVDGGQNDADGLWDGVTTVANLPAGDYVITQDATGDGYVASATTFTGSVPAGGVGDLRIWNDLVPPPDTDGDGIIDANDSCPVNANLGTDWDNDGVDDACDPMPDRDADGVEDSVDNCPDVANTTQDDADNNGVGDACDVKQPVDTDNDGLSDDEEAKLGTDSAKADTDGDGVNDGDEVKAGTNPLVDETATPVDTDNDGLTDEEEAKLGTDPKVADSDADGLSDGDEVNTHKTDPLNADTDGDGMSDGDEVTADRDPLKAEQASLAVTQTVAPGSAAVDDVVTFTITITNNGQLPVENIAIANSLKGLSDLTCDPAVLSTLSPGASITCTATYTVTKQDDKAGSVANTVTVTSDNAKVDPVAAEVAIGAQVVARSIVAQAAVAAVTVDFAAYTPGTYDPSISTDSPTGGTVESLTPGGFVQCGSYLYYQALVTAASSGDFTFGYIFDSQSGTGWTLTYSAPVRVEIFSQSGSGNAQLVDNGDGTYTLTGLEDGDVVEVLMVTELLCLGTNPVTGQVNVSVQFDAKGIGKQTVPLKGRGEDLQAALSIVKNGPASVDPGGSIQYTITVTNTGNGAADNVTVTDTLPAGIIWYYNSAVVTSGNLSVNLGTIAAGGSASITVTGTVPTDGTVCGPLSNTAYVGDQPSNDVPTTINCAPGVNAYKTTVGLTDENGNGRADAGETVTWTITVENTGNTTLTNVPVSDLLTGGASASIALTDSNGDPFTSPIAFIPVGGSVILTATYTLDQADLNGGVTLENCVVVTGDTNADDNCDSYDVPGTPGATADKSAELVTGEDGLNAGDQIRYTITITNTGNVDLVDSPVSDVLTGGSGSFQWTDSTWAPLASPVTSVDITVAQGSVTLYGVYTITQGDLDTQDDVTIENCVYLNGSAEPADCVDTPVSGTPGVTASKSSQLNPGQDGLTAGDTITYTITVTNTGNTTLTNVALNDVLTVDAIPASIDWTSPVDFDGTIDEILVGAASVVITGTYTMTQADIDGNVTIENCINVSLDADKSDDCASDDITGTPGVDAAKTSGGYTDANGNGRADAGELITYTIMVTNTGNTTLTDVALNDVLTVDAVPAPITWPNGFDGTIDQIAVGDQVTVQGTYAITQQDIDNGATILNCVNVEGDPDDTNDCATDQIEQVPGIDAEKTSPNPFVDVDGNGVVSEGDTITYTIVVTNTGNTTLSGIDVTDVVPGAGNFTWTDTTIASLAPGTSRTFNPVYTLTQADIEAGSIENCVTAAVDKTTTDTSCVTDTIEQLPAVAILKESLGLQDTNGNGRADAGETIRYRIVVTNTGNTTLTNISVTDELKVSSVVVPNGFEWDPAFDGTIDGPLAPNAQVTLYGTYEITQGDLDTTSGVIVLNCATATVGQARDTSCDDDLIQGVRLVDAAKTSGGIDLGTNGRADAGDRITYTIVVTNTGSTTLKDVLVGDLLTGTALPGAITWLDGFDGTIDQINVGGAATAVTVTAIYTLTQGDIDAGATIQNCVDVTGDTNDANDCVTDKITSVPGVDAAKTSGGVDDGEDNILNAGDTIEYTIVVTNTGNTTLEDVEVEDVVTGGTGTFSWDAGTVLPIPTIEPGDSVTLYGSYEITQDDLDADNGVGIENCVDVTGDTNDANDCVTDKVTGTPGVDAAKTSGGLDDENANGRADAGETITYTIEVTNTGNTTLKNVVVGDELTGTVSPGAITWLDGFDGTIDQINVGDSETVTATYSLNQDDIDAGVTIQNCVAVATDPTSTNNCVKDTVEGVPGLHLEKTSDTITDIGLGEEITYDFAVTNTGNVTLYDVAVEDPMLDAAGVTVPTIDQLDPGQTVTVSATYTVTQADVDEGYVYNCATATDGETTSSQDCLRIDIPQTAALAISKTCPDPATVKRVGDEITYQVTVINSGNVTVYDIMLDDARDGTFGEYPTTLAPGEDFTVEFTTTITSDDAVNGNLDNSVTVTGNALLENEAAQESAIPVVFFSQENGFDHSNGKTEVPVEAWSSVTCPYAPATGLVIEKTADAVDADDVVAGKVITYSFALTNTGDVTLDDVVINDDLNGLIWDDGFEDGMVGTLAPGETVIATATYVVTDADVEAGHVLNCATATSGDIASNESCVDVPTDAQPALAIIKTATPVKVTKAGEVITYTFVITNTGNVPLEDVTVVDEMLDKAGVEIPPVGDLKPGESKTVTAQYTVTEADMKLDEIFNTAVATDGTTTSEPDTATVPVVHPKPAPKPVPAPTKLPNTGSGDGAAGQDGLWMIAATGAAILAAGALGLRKRAQM